MELGKYTLREYMHKNSKLKEREMKILFYNIIKAFYTLNSLNIVHNDISPDNILINSPEHVLLCDFGDSFEYSKQINSSLFPIFFPKNWVTLAYLSPERMTWARISNIMRFIKYDPYKSDVFSIGLSILHSCGVDIKQLNEYGENYDVHIMQMLTINYDFIAKDSLRKVFYRLLRENLQKDIDNKIQEFRYESLKGVLRSMLEVDIMQRSNIDQVFNDAKLLVGDFS